MKQQNDSLLNIQNVSIGFGDEPIVHKASLKLYSGKISALIGESGSGKTLLAKSLIDLLPSKCMVQSGQIFWHGIDLLSEASASRASLRGKEIAFIFQDPLSSLNPSLKIGIQLTEALEHHSDLPKGKHIETAIDMLRQVQIQSPERVMQSYPHQLSGGMRQRVMIAAALLLKPALLIADEPTTALDMVIRDEIMGMMTKLATEIGAAVLIISHDLGAVARLADTIMVMEKGIIVETGDKNALLSKPKHPYTQKLLEAIPQPSLENGPEHPPHKTAPLISLESLCVSFKDRALIPWSRKEHQVVKDISLDIREGETLAIIGESGSGKTTLARTVGSLQEKTEGEIHFSTNNSAQTYAKSGKLQYIFQDSAAALNPRFKVGTSIAESLLPLGLSQSDRQKRVIEALEQVSLPADITDRFPHQLSGGQRQRVCIARAIAPHPEIIIADEPVSALDVTVQKQVLDLFLSLKAELNFACLFISHDLGVVEHIADRVGVLLKGELVEIGETSQVFNAPRHKYTRQLLSASPYLKKSNHGYELARRYSEQPA